MGHVLYALDRLILTGDFEESLIAVSKGLDLAVKIWLRCDVRFWTQY
jgi:hypothetical protein